MILQLLLGLTVAHLGWSIICLEINVRKARALNVPIVRLPVDPVNFLWVFLQAHVWNFLDRLPIPWSSYPDFVRFSYRGWHFREKSNPAIRHGPVWALVTPVTFYLQFTDPDAINELFVRRSDFIRPVKNYKLLEVYGPCISTAGWDDWARHRKVLAAPFNESIMHFVWEESLRQATAMLRYWTDAPCVQTGFNSIQRDTRTLSLNVLAATGFRKSYSFRGSTATTSQDQDSSYRDALQTVLDNAILIMIIPYKYLRGSLIPKKLRRVGDAARAFKEYMETMLEEETRALSENKPGSGGIMSTFVRALDVHQREVVEHPDVKESKDGKKGLSIDEIFGNIFVINFAGHDTTANTLAFSMLLLAAHPEVQDWVAEEVAAVQGTSTGDMSVGKWNYHAVYPRLKRCQAVMLETLRLYPPIMSLPKWTKGRAQSIKVGKQTLVIPPGVGTSPHLLAMHTHPRYWSDPLTWKPSRWIIGSGTRMADEELWTPTPNTYFPWSAGPQNCPGEKFSRVESVAVLACLLKAHRIDVAREPGEDEVVARKRAFDCTNDVNLEILLRMRNADRVKLVCKAT